MSRKRPDAPRDKRPSTPRTESRPESRAPREAATPWKAERPSERPRERQGERKTVSRSRGHARPASTPADVALLYGFHAVREALRSQARTILRVVATEAAAEKLAPELTARQITPQIVSSETIGQRLPAESVHQGVLMEARHLPDLDLGDLPDDGFILVLDQVTDPHNVGAILRTAAAFKLDGIVTTERHSPAISGVLAKAASGGLEHVPIVTVVNLARALDTLGKRGYLRVGLDSEGPRSLEDEVLTKPLALVLGAEGKGLRRLTRENCDVLARIDMPGAIKSLNVSNACAVALTIARLKLR
jgi:23S rRNA (guanosine2251-2'-O)-methyltransferase